MSERNNGVEASHRAVNATAAGGELREEPRRKTRQGKVWDWTGFGDKTAWDWMQLLIVPVVLAVGALLFNLSLNARQLDTEERRAEAQIEA